jgi:hypothetical protein
LYSSEKFLVSVKIFLANRIEIAGKHSPYDTQLPADRKCVQGSAARQRKLHSERAANNLGVIQQKETLPAFHAQHGLLWD